MAVLDGEKMRLAELQVVMGLWANCILGVRRRRGKKETKARRLSKWFPQTEYGKNRFAWLGTLVLSFFWTFKFRVCIRTPHLAHQVKLSSEKIKERGSIFLDLNVV